MSGTRSAPRLGKRNATEFRQSIADVAAELRRKIEAEVAGLDPAPAAIAARRRTALAPDGFEFFCVTYFPHYIKRPEARSRLHDFLYRRLPEIIADPAGQNDAIAAPRGEAKSTLVSQLFTLWCIARKAKHYVMLLMDAFDQAAVMVEAIKAELEVNPRLAMDMPEIAGKGSVWKEGVIVTTNGIKVEGAGAGKKIRGRRHGPHRPDLALLDDIENDENVREPKQRDKLEGWVNKAVLNLGEAGGSLDVIIIGTVLHYDSVLSRLMRNPLWRSAKFASIVRWPEDRALWDQWEEVLRNEGVPAADAFYAARKARMDKGALVSWPGVRPLEALMKLRVKIGHDAFDSEQQNDPVSSTDALFGTVTFWVDRLADWIHFGACDPSLGKQNRARDPSAILIGGLNRETNVLDVVEALIRRRLPDKIIEDIIALEEQYRCVRWAIEAVQFQEFFRTSLVARGQARGIPVPAVPIIPIGDKGLRIERLQPHVLNAAIRFHAGQTTLLDQLRHFPMVDHDDGLDCLEMLWMTAIGRPASAGATVAPPGAPRASGGTMRGRVRMRMRRR